MKKNIIIQLIFCMMAFLPFWAIGQLATENTTVGAKIIPSIAVTEVKPMHFGTMTVKAAQGGTCVVSPAGVRSRTGGVTLSNLAPAMSLATYSVTGEPGKSYTITLPLTITVFYTTFSMTVSNLLAKPASGPASFNATGTIGTSGSEQFTIGATLNVAAGQEEGLYTGNFPITVTYN